MGVGGREWVGVGGHDGNLGTGLLQEDAKGEKGISGSTESAG